MTNEKQIIKTAMALIDSNDVPDVLKSSALTITLNALWSSSEKICNDALKEALEVTKDSGCSEENMGVVFDFAYRSIWSRRNTEN